MRNILRVGAVLFALLVATDVASAQGGGGGGGRRGGGMNGTMLSERYFADITLSEDQKGKVAPILAWYDSVSATLPRAQRGADGTPPDSAAAAAAMQARQKHTLDFQAKLKAVLTPEQVTKFDANVAAAGQRGGRRGGGF